MRACARRSRCSTISIGCRTTRSRTAAPRLRSFRGVVRHGCAHCLEAALFAAVVLEQHGYPPLVLSFESIDQLDHVIFVYQQRRALGLGRAVARSGPARTAAGVRHAARAGAQLRRSLCRLTPDGSPVMRSSIWTRVMGDYDWRLADTNVWKVERMLLDYPHHRIASSDARFKRLRNGTSSTEQP